MKDQAFSERVRQLVLEYANGVYSRFGQMVGVAQPTIKRYLEGDALPNFQVIRKICNTCEITPNWLVYGWEPKYQKGITYTTMGFRIVADKEVPETYDPEFTAVPLLTDAAWDAPKAKAPVINLETCTDYLLVPNIPNTNYVATIMPDQSMRGEIEKSDVLIVSLDVPKQLTARTLLLVKTGEGVVTVRRPLGDVLYSNDPARFPPDTLKTVKVLGAVAEVRRRTEAVRKVKNLVPFEE